MLSSAKTEFLFFLGATYQNRRSLSKHERGSERYDRERLTARDRETEHYDINDEDLLNEHTYVARERDRGPRGHSLQRMPTHRGYDDDFMHDPRDRGGGGGGGGERMLMSSRDRDRYQQLAPHSSRRVDRERDLDRDYSPHRASGNNRRVLNAM